MTMTREEIINFRINTLRQFDSYIRNVLDNEDIFLLWISEGLEDGYDDFILFEYANDDNLWNDTVIIFNKCCKLAN
jgi:hypothetical protein